MKKQNRKFYSMFVIFSLMLFGITGCLVVDPDQDIDNQNYTAQEPVEMYFNVSDNSKVTIEAINGTIKIIGKTNLNQIEIRGEKIVASESNADAEANLKNLDIQVVKSREMLQVKTIQPENTHGRNYTVNYELYVPIHVSVSIKNINGLIEVDSLQNEVYVSLVNGNISLDDIEGNVDVGVTNGQIAAQVTIPSRGKVNLQTTNGAISLNIPQATSADLYAAVTNGNIKTSNLSLQNVNQSATSLKARLGTGNGSINLKTVNGNIQMSGY
ncbi:hypothetical protein JW964_07875 [candidate division KSB1 bacterium]|nr:hypothetical protein [candidate division KSB1 bacterium]